MYEKKDPIGMQTKDTIGMRRALDNHYNNQEWVPKMRDLPIKQE